MTDECGSIIEKNFVIVFVKLQKYRKINLIIKWVFLIFEKKEERKMVIQRFSFRTKQIEGSFKYSEFNYSFSFELDEKVKFTLGFLMFFYLILSTNFLNKYDNYSRTI